MRVHANEVVSIKARAECVHECSGWCEGTAPEVIEWAREHTEITGHSTDAFITTRQMFFTDQAHVQ